MPDVWINGDLVDSADAVVAVDDRGFTVGDGVFEAIRLDERGPFAVTRHLHRLRLAAQRVGLRLVDDDVLRDAIDAVVASCVPGGAPQVIRITLSAGRGGDTARSGHEPTLVVTLRAGGSAADSVAVATSPWPRNERAALAGVKSTSYAENVVALEHAHRSGCDEVLFANTVGGLCEGAGSNVFIESDGVLVTPATSSGCLAGVTRALLLEAGVGVEADVPIEALARATEAFLTSTSREVQPIHAIDGRVITRVPGPLTAEAAATWSRHYGPGTPLDP